MQEPSDHGGWVQRAWDSPAICAAMVDAAGVVLSVNHAFEIWSGGATLVGKPFVSLVHEGQREAVLRLLAGQALSADQIEVGMFPDDEGIPVDVRVSISGTSQRIVLVEPHQGTLSGAVKEILKLNDRLAETQRELTEKNRALQTALETVKRSSLYIRKLEGILPICMTCKAVRDDQDEWTKLDRYLQKQGAVSLSHGLCPDCSEAMQAELEIS